MKKKKSFLNKKILTNRLLILFIIPILTFHSCRYERDNANQYYKIKKFVDGDTFWIDDGSQKGLKIRLIGVNTPETVHPRKPVEYYGREASEYVKKVLTNKEVRLEYDLERKDQYGRTLAYVYLRDGTFLNAKLVEEGYAQVMTVPPNVKHTDLFVKLQRQARENNKGLWKKESE